MLRKLALFALLCLCASSLFASWDGTYQWVNNTNKNNWGKVKDITIRVESVSEDYLYNLFLVLDGEEYRIFPLILPSSSSYESWHDYDEKSAEGEAFRKNNKRMNTTPIAPGKWKMGESTVTEDSIRTTVIASAFNIKITTEVEYLFSLDENGSKQLTFSMDADQDIAKGKFFQNPEKGSDGKFVLTAID